MKHFSTVSVALTLALLFIITTAFITSSSTSKEGALSESLATNLIKSHKLRLYKGKQAQLKEALEDYFERALAAGDVVGAGISIVQGDSILISEGFGRRSVETSAAVDGETVFRLGSLSKGFGGVLAASLVSEGILDFDDKIASYLPEFTFGDEKNTQSITLKHILSHTSGTPYHSFTNLVEAGIPMSKIAGRFEEVTPINTPGEQYSYQNAMFALSQEVIQKASGEDVKSLLNTKFFKPLGMSQVSMNHSDLLEQTNVAFPHKRIGLTWRKLPLTDKYYNAVLAGGINASAEDMAKWMRFLLGHKPKILAPSAFQKVFEPIISFKNKRKYYQRWDRHLTSSYGFGWRIHEFQKSDEAGSETVWHHGGSVNNYRNEIALYPEADLGICVLLNGNSKLARNVIPHVYAIVKRIYEEKEAVGLVENGSSLTAFKDSKG